jgi:hypothetical protein
MTKLLTRAMAVALASLPVVTAQAAPAANLVVFRRNQVYGSANFYWNQLQNGAYIQQFPVSSNIVVPPGQKFVVTGIRYWFTGSYGADLSLGFSASGVHNSTYQKMVRVPTQGSLASFDYGEQFITGISFAAGTQVELRVTKVNAGSSDTVVNAYLYGYFEP